MAAPQRTAAEPEQAKRGGAARGNYGSSLFLRSSGIIWRFFRWLFVVTCFFNYHPINAHNVGQHYVECPDIENHSRCRAFCIICIVRIDCKTLAGERLPG